MRKGWEDCKLEDYIKLIDYRGRTPVKTESGVRLITAKNVKLGYLQVEPQEFIDPKNFDSWMTRGIPNFGDVIFTTEAPLANVAQIDTKEKLAFAQRIIVMQPRKDKIDQAFLKYLLLSESTRKRILDKGTGATVTGIKSSLLKKIPISIPTIPEQKRIVAILDEAFAAIDKAKANTEKNLQNAKELFESYLQSVFENKENKSEVKTFEDVCELIGGSQPSKDDFIYEPRNGYIRLIQVRDYKTNKYITYIPKHKAKRFCSKEDIMIGRYGPPIFGIFKGLEGAYNVALMKAEINTKICNSDYFYWFLKTNNLREFVERSSKRAAGQDGVRKELLDKYPVPIPTLFEQKILVKKINLLSEETMKLESIYQHKLNDLEELKKSVLRKAFNGELKTSKAVAV